MDDIQKLAAILGKGAGRKANPKKKPAKPQTPAATVGQGVGGYGAKQLPPAAVAKPGPSAAYDLSAPTTPEQAKALIKAETHLAYGGQTQALKQLIEQTPQYFQDFRQNLSGLQNGQQGVYDKAVQNIAGIGQGIGQSDAAVLAAARGGAYTDAASRGATPNQGVFDDAAKAAAVLQGGVGDWAGLLTAQGAAENSYLANRSASSGPLQVQAQRADQKDMASLKADKGAFKVTALDKLRTAAATAAEQKHQDHIAALSLLSKDQLARLGYKTDITQSKITAGSQAAGLKATRLAARKAAAAKQKAIDNSIEPGTNGRTHAEWLALSIPERNRITARVEKNSGSSGDQAKQDHKANHKLVKDATARYINYQKTKDHPVDFNDPSKGLRLPTEPEIRAQIRKEMPALTEPQLNRAVKLAQKRINKSYTQGLGKELGKQPPTKIGPVTV